MIRYILFLFVSIAEKRIPFSERILQYAKVIFVGSVSSYLINSLTGWYFENKAFVFWFLIEILVMVFFGIWHHLKHRNFSLFLLIVKTTIIVICSIGAYIVLEGLIQMAGDYAFIKHFENIIRIGTLIYPISKTARSIYEISGQKIPPKSIMERIKRFEKSFNIKDLI